MPTQSICLWVLWAMPTRCTHAMCLDPMGVVGALAWHQVLMPTLQLWLCHELKQQQLDVEVCECGVGLQCLPQRLFAFISQPVVCLLVMLALGCALCSCCCSLHSHSSVSVVFVLSASPSPCAPSSPIPFSASHSTCHCARLVLAVLPCGLVAHWSTTALSVLCLS